MKRQHKYRAKPCVIEGIRFASQREGRRFLELRMLEKAGEIRELELQPRFPLYALRASNGEVIKVADYVADFQFREGRDGALVVEDVKGMPTETYRLKKRIFEAQYGMQIREVR